LDRRAVIDKRGELAMRPVGVAPPVFDDRILRATRARVVTGQTRSRQTQELSPRKAVCTAPFQTTLAAYAFHDGRPRRGAYSFAHCVSTNASKSAAISACPPDLQEHPPPALLVRRPANQTTADFVNGLPGAALRRSRVASHA